MKKETIILILILTSHCLCAQNFNVALSPKHSSKLSNIKSGHKRLTKFYKFYKKDSAAHVRKQEKYYNKILDSTYRSDRKQERMKRRMTRKGIVIPGGKMSTVDSVDRQLKQWYAVMRDSTSSDSLKVEAREKVKELTVQKAKLHPGFGHLMERHHINGDSLDWKTVSGQVPGLDTLSRVFDSDPDKLFDLAEKQSESHLQRYSEGLPSEFAKADELKDMPGNLKKDYEQYTDRERLQNQSKEKVVGEAIDYFTQHAGKLNMSQAKVSKLMARYKDIANSDDLTKAVKRTSMQGKTFWERLVIGGNFKVISTAPVSLDLSPQLGYKFTTRFAVGLGMNYRYTFRDSIKHKSYISPSNTGFKLFASYDVVKGFFAYGEAERSGMKMNKNDHTSSVWKNNFFVGIGKKILIHPKIYLNTLLLYNLSNENNNPVYPRRFQVRFGFQLSELATRKERISYDPNR